LSSMIKVLTCLHLFLAGSTFFCPRSFPASFSLGSAPNPIPAHECRVEPPMLTAAMPVDAVMAT
ncbi:hypothetical protein JAAARDRAFT_92464, partial [Jaapia argillacea MUCL 33604]